MEYVEYFTMISKGNYILQVIIGALLITLVCVNCIYWLFKGITKVLINKIWKRAIQSYDAIQVARLLTYVHKREVKLTKQDFDLIIAYLEKKG